MYILEITGMPQPSPLIDKFNLHYAMVEPEKYVDNAESMS